MWVPKELTPRGRMACQRGSLPCDPDNRTCWVVTFPPSQKRVSLRKTNIGWRLKAGKFSEERNNSISSLVTPWPPMPYVHYSGILHLVLQVLWVMTLFNTKCGLQFATTHFLTHFRAKICILGSMLYKNFLSGVAGVKKSASIYVGKIHLRAPMAANGCQIERKKNCGLL